jgi:NAD(P)-dependent dehydrogenase (short-subunit alcohol dehydrogenase family)
MEDKPVALVTGANKGIGLQIAKELAWHGFIVLVAHSCSGNARERWRNFRTSLQYFTIRGMVELYFTL